MTSKRIPNRAICTILPPFILTEIAKNGAKEHRDAALSTLQIDATMRLSRATHSLMESGAHQSLMATATAHVQRTVFDTQHSQELPGRVVRFEGGEPAGDNTVNEAFEGLGATYDFYSKVYSRNSIDDEGMHLDATVHFDENYNNAFWNGQQMIFGDGDGAIFNRFTTSVDVIAHELTHGVTGSQANLLYSGESGALNESISDVFGSLVKQFIKNQTAADADWLIGQGLFTADVQGTALRSLKAPGTAYDDPTLGKDPQPSKMSRFVRTSADHGGVHTNSGIPNHAFYVFATILTGNAWERPGRVWYETLRDPRLSQTASFQDFANLTVINAGRLFPGDQQVADAVRAGWDDVEIKAT
jgi:Zn-dependent metalloprotease